MGDRGDATAVAVGSPPTGRAGSAPPADLLHLDKVSFSYAADAPVLDEITLGVPPGAVVSVVGPSGCGKSTLLSLVANLEHATSGTITWAPDQSAEPQHPLTMMFQKDTLLPWLTVEDNIGLHFRYRPGRLSKAERHERVAGLVKLAGLGGAERKYPYQLSGGMRRRTAFLTAVAPRPRMLLLDEPFSALDEPTRIAIHQDVFEILRSQNITVVLITHDLGEAISLSDRVVVLSSRPARAVREFEIPFGDERNMMELRENEAFLRLYGEIWESLAREIRAGQHQMPGPAVGAA